MAAGTAPEKTQWSPSLWNRPDGIAVPGMILAGSVIHLAVHAGCKRSRASRKLGAEAFLSCASLPVMWHFKHGAAGLVNRPRAIARSASVKGSTLGGINGSGGADMASKKSVSLRISSSDK